MFVIIVYDISNNKARTKFHKFLLGYAEWTQYSVFESNLEETKVKEIIKKGESLINPATDSIRIYRLCNTCNKNIEIVGSGVKYEEKSFYIA